jgi:tetratricopeptide (TPR) repeat protein
VTTSSLQAFHAFSLGEDQHRMGHDLPEAESFYKEALRLDPNFAMAYARLGVVYANVGATNKSIDFLKKADDLRERVTERERMYIESQYALAQNDVPKALESYKLFVDTYPHDASAWNNLAITYQSAGDLELSAECFKKAWDMAKWDNIAATNAASTYIGLDRIDLGEHYLEDAQKLAGGTDVSFHSSRELSEYLQGKPDWEGELQWAAPRPDGFLVEATAAMIYFEQGRMREANQHWEHAGQRTEQQHLSDSAGALYGTRAMQDALVGDCSNARSAAHQALKIDQSAATVPMAALALAYCGEGAAALKESERLAAEQPTNTLVNLVYLPQVKAAIALSEHKYGDVAKILDAAAPYTMGSKLPQLLGAASLALHNPQQAITDFKPGIKYRALSLEQGAGNVQAPDYTLSLLGTARAQALSGDKAGAAQSYQKLLAMWKNADADFAPAAEAKREAAGIQK